MDLMVPSAPVAAPHHEATRRSRECGATNRGRATLGRQRYRTRAATPPRDQALFSTSTNACCRTHLPISVLSSANHHVLATGAEMCHVRGRLTFGAAVNTAPFRFGRRHPPCHRRRRRPGSVTTMPAHPPARATESSQPEGCPQSPDVTVLAAAPVATSPPTVPASGGVRLCSSVFSCRCRVRSAARDASLCPPQRRVTATPRRGLLHHPDGLNAPSRRASARPRCSSESSTCAPRRRAG